jgi:ribose transport system substrate-binding protein
MLKRLFVFLLVLVLSLTVFTACGGSGEKEAGAEATDETVIGFAVSTLSNDFFVMMKDAGDAKAKELGITLTTLDAQDSSETQATQIEDFISQGVDLIILNPVDSDAIGTSVEACNEAGIPVITVTRPSNAGEVVQHLDIDNKEAGALIAGQMIKDLGGEGKVAVLEGIAGAPSANDRQEGFKTGIEGSKIEIAASLTANYNRDEGATVMEDILQSNPDLAAVYAHNDEMALGAVRTIAAAGKTDQIKVYGIDAVDDAIAALKTGEMAATVQQQPALQMETALESAMKYLAGEKVEPLVNIPLKLLTPADVK